MLLKNEIDKFFHKIGHKFNIPSESLNFFILLNETRENEEAVIGK